MSSRGPGRDVYSGFEDILGIDQFQVSFSTAKKNIECVLKVFTNMFESCFKEFQGNFVDIVDGGQQSVL